MNTLPVPSSLPTREELKSFHAVDRRLYKRLVIELGRDTMLCMKVIALWMWLEEVGFPHLVSGLLNIDSGALALIFDEAVCCLSCIESPVPPFFSLTGNVSQIPLTKGMMSPMEINLTSLYKNRSDALRRISNTVNEVFVKAFDDIIQQVSPNNPRIPLPYIPTAPDVPSEDQNRTRGDFKGTIWQEGSVIEDSSLWGKPSIWKS